MYNTEFENGEVSDLTANAIAKTMYAQCDEEGKQYVLLYPILDYWKDGHVIEFSDKPIVVNAQELLRKATKGWQTCDKWKYESTSWERLLRISMSHTQ